jgi:hypothetical protein
MLRICFSFISIVFVLIACGSHKTSKHFVLYQEDTLHLYRKDTLPNGNTIIRPNFSLTKIDTSIIKIDFFDTIPESISRSGEFCTYDSIAIANNKYIFLTDIVSYAVIRINGKDIYLSKDYDKCVEIAENTFKDVYSGNAYTVIFTHKSITHNNGVWYETGTLDIKNSKNRSIVKLQGNRIF